MALLFIALGGFIKVFPLLLSRIDTYEKVIENSENLGIDNSTLFYSEEPLTSKAEQELTNRLSSVGE